VPRLQKRPIVPPLPADKGLGDFSQVVQENAEELFELAHLHDVKTAVPSDTEGEVGDIRPVVVEGVFYLYVKFSAGWKKVTLT